MAWSARSTSKKVVLLIVRRLDGLDVLDESRLPLVAVAADEAAEVLEAEAGRPQVEGARPPPGTARLVALVVYVTLDLNQPRRGLITVSQEPLERLLATMAK